MKKLAGFIAAMCLALPVFAAQDVSVSGAWVRATAPGQDTAAVSAVITSKQEARLVGVSSPVAAHAELHTMRHENGMMMMRAVPSLALLAGQPVSLGAGDHIMLVGLKHPLKVGDSVPVSLVVELADKHKITVGFSAEVRTSAPDMDMGGMKGMDGMH